MEKGAEISRDVLHDTLLGVKQTKDKGLFLCIFAIFMKIAAV